MKIIKGIIFVIFAAEGITKLISLPFHVNYFTQSGYPLSFMYLIGILELAGAIGILIPKLSLLANIGLLFLLVGIYYTHIKNGDAVQMMGLAFLATALLITHMVLWFKKRRDVRLYV